MEDEGKRENEELTMFRRIGQISARYRWWVIGAWWPGPLSHAAVAIVPQVEAAHHASGHVDDPELTSSHLQPDTGNVEIKN